MPGLIHSGPQTRRSWKGAGVTASARAAAGDDMAGPGLVIVYQTTCRADPYWSEHKVPGWSGLTVALGLRAGVTLLCRAKLLGDCATRREVA